MKILQNDNNNSKVVTVRLLVFLIDCIVPLLKVVCSPPKTILATNDRGYSTLFPRFQVCNVLGHLIRKVYHISTIVVAQKHLAILLPKFASIKT